MVEKKITEDRWESKRGAGKLEKCVEEMTIDKYLKRRMKQTLAAMVGAQKQAARERLSSLLGYAVIEQTRTRMVLSLERS